jgi:hypothetical protein
VMSGRSPGAPQSMQLRSATPGTFLGCPSPLAVRGSVPTMSGVWADRRYAPHDPAQFWSVHWPNGRYPVRCGDATTAAALTVKSTLLKPFTE